MPGQQNALLFVRYIATRDSSGLCADQLSRIYVAEVWRINALALCIWTASNRKRTVLVAGSDGAVDVKPSNHHVHTIVRHAKDAFPRWTIIARGHQTAFRISRFLISASIVWASRNLPSYLGPSVVQLAHLFVLCVVNSLTVFMLLILLARTLYSLGVNTTTIESWEIERHATLLRRARHYGGYLEGPGGVRVRIRKQEFPYDIGIWSNIREGMGGSANVLSWFWPFARTPDRSTGLEYEVNGFEDANVSWPPPDPDRIPLPPKDFRDSIALAGAETSGYDVQAFNDRKAQDLRRQRAGVEIERRKRFHKRLQEDLEEDEPQQSDSDHEKESNYGEEGWRNSEGERLRDFGVDEDIEFYDEEDIPLGVLIQRRAQAALKELK
ncbi:Palmitoyltransferase [Aspergillus alliaceus]|uniref:Palmitoyltransferase n=1 Tax=Petromyces alliaceus TaxID=209559 RepID=A0A8H6E999_PETAA|nr:Palmitoyltransferase [Aspergillus burnettii]